MFGRCSASARRVLAVVALIGLLSVACAGDDSGGGSGGSSAAGTEATGTDATDPDEGRTPTYGGRIVFSRESETASPWTPANLLGDMSANQAIRTVYDSLTYTGQDGETYPFLLESIEPNDDFTVWTLVARDGVTFHDGTPFDADTLIDHFERARTSLVLATTLLDIDEVVKVDPMTVEVRMRRSWSTFPSYLSTQPGLVASPTWLAAVDAGEADPTEPVGTGPFVFAEYNSGQNFRVVRNPDYWLSDADGNQYPYLDEIEFIVQEEDLTRDRALTSGQVDITHTDRGESVLGFREAVEAGELEMYEIRERPEVTYTMLNVANEDSPVSDVRIRRAMAHAIDQDLRNQARVAGAYPVANSPFPPTSDGYIEDNGWPTYDPDKARELVEAYKADTGTDTVEISFNTTADPENKATVELAQQFLEEVGIDVTIAQVEQGQFLEAAATGDFEALTFRNHGGDAEGGRVWWHSETAAPIGSFGLNLGRIMDDDIDAALDTLREVDDEATQQEAAQAINRAFVDGVYNIWFDWINWSIVHHPRVNGVRTPINLPNGQPSAIHTIGAPGGIGLAQVWVDDGA